MLHIIGLTDVETNIEGSAAVTTMPEAKNLIISVRSNVVSVAKTSSSSGGGGRSGSCSGCSCRAEE